MDQKAKPQKTPTTGRASVQQNLGPFASKYLACLTEQISGFGWPGAQRQDAIEKHSKAVAGAERVLAVLPEGTRKYLFNFNLTPFGPERIQATDHGFSIIFGRDEFNFLNQGQLRQMDWEHFSGKGDPDSWVLRSNAAGGRVWHVSVEDAYFPVGGYKFEVYGFEKRTMGIAAKALLDLGVRVPSPRQSEHVFSLVEMSITQGPKEPARARSDIPERTEMILRVLENPDYYRDRILKGFDSSDHPAEAYLWHLHPIFNNLLTYLLDTAEERVARYKTKNIIIPYENIKELIFEEGLDGKTWTARGRLGLAREKWVFKLQGGKMNVFKDDETKPRATLDVAITAGGEIRVFRPNKIGDEIFDPAFLKKTKRDPVAAALASDVRRWISEQNTHLYPDRFNYVVEQAQDRAYNASRALEILGVLPQETARRLMETPIYSARIGHNETSTGFFFIYIRPEEIGVPFENIVIPGFIKKGESQPQGPRIEWVPSKHTGKYPHVQLSMFTDKEKGEPTGFTIVVRESDDEGIRHARQILESLSIQIPKS